MAANRYPSPCDKCEKNCGVGCLDWKIRYLYRQKQINAYARKVLQPKPHNPNKFTYEHPDRVRCFLTDGPCKGCSLEKNCDTPCGAYLRWYDARMELARKKAGL